MRIAEFLHQSRRGPVTCLPDDTLQAAARAMYAHSVGALPVCELGTRLVGIISERDLVRVFARPDWSELGYIRVRDAMTSRVVTCSPDQTLEWAQETMRSNHFRHLPVMDGGKVIGILSLRDTLAVRLHETEEELNFFRDLAVAARH